MTEGKMLLLTLILGSAILLTRVLPFLIFSHRDKPPAIIQYLGKTLPAAMMGLLVVYCMKDYDFTSLRSLLPFLISVAAVAGLHLWKHNTVLSISTGTVLYMILIRLI